MSAGLSRRAFIQQIAGVGAATLLASCGGQVVTPSPSPKLRRVGFLSGNSTSPAHARRAAELVNKILKGARPADLPVEPAMQIDFIVNLAAAQRVGLTIPDGVLRQATEVIR